MSMYASSAITWQPTRDVMPTLSAVDNWCHPDKDSYFFCDLHADADAFLRSLKLSHLITRSSQIQQIQLTTKGQYAQIIIGGDCFDKGPSNLDLLRVIKQLKDQQADLVLLAGNHDIRLYAGLLALDVMHDLRQAHFFVRMGRKTASLFAEIYQTYCQDIALPNLSDDDIKAQLFPTQDWFTFFPEYAADMMSDHKIAKELKQIADKQTAMLEACSDYGLTLPQLYVAAKMAQQLFTQPDGEFSWFFEQLDLIHISGSYCFTHAGLDDKIALRLGQEPPAALNNEFRQQLKQGRIFQMYYSEFGNVFRTKYRANDWPLTELGANQLRKQNLFAIVNGHRSHENGQQLFVRNGLLNFECDTQLNSNCRKKSNIQTPGEAVTIFFASGLVSALSSDYPLTKQFHPQHLSSQANLAGESSIAKRFTG